MSEIPEKAIEAAEAAYDWESPDAYPYGPEPEPTDGERLCAALEAALPALQESWAERVEKELRDWCPGPIDKPPPRRDEWGPVCAGCGNEEFRIDGFCSIECRDRYEFAHDILRAIRGEPGDG